MLKLSIAKTTAAGLATFKACPLSELHLTHGKVGEKELAAFQLENVVRLGFHRSSLDDGAWARVLKCEQLTQLDVRQTELTDARLAQLSVLRGLKWLFVNENGVSESAVRELSARLPACRIKWDSGLIEPAGSDSQ